MEWKSAAENAALLTEQRLDSISSETRRRADRLIRQAYDLLAGEEFAERVTWNNIRPAELRRAESLLADALSIAPPTGRFHYVQGLLSAARRDYVSALSELNKAAESDDINAVQLARVAVLSMSGRENESIQLMNSLRELAIDVPAARYNIARILHQSGNLEGAQSELTQLVKEAPDYAEAHDRLAEIHYETGSLEKARHHCSVAYSLKPDNETIATHYGLLLAEAGRLAEAQRVLEKILEQFPTNIEARTLLGPVYAKTQQFQRADEVLAQALDLAPDHPIAVENTAYVHMISARFDSARDLYRKALSLGNHPSPDRLNKNLKGIDELEVLFHSLTVKSG